MVLAFMAATFFSVPIAPPSHIILRDIDSSPADSQVVHQTTTPDLTEAFSPSDQASGSWLATLPQPIYPPPPAPGSSQGKPQTTSTPAPTPAPTPTPQPQQPTTENWADRIWRRYKGGN